MTPAMLALMQLLDLALTHAVEIRDLLAKEGGATDADVAALRQKHQEERDRVQAQIDAMPDDA